MSSANDHHVKVRGQGRRALTDETGQRKVLFEGSRDTETTTAERKHSWGKAESDHEPDRPGAKVQGTRERLQDAAIFALMSQRTLYVRRGRRLGLWRDFPGDEKPGERAGGPPGVNLFKRWVEAV